MNITIYCGAANGNNDNYQKEAIKLGKWIGKNKHTLIYGGSKVGLMGIIADAVKNEGGKVIGIRPYFLEEEDIKEDLDEMLFVDTMAQRKTKMIELGDYFIALPGGTGTLEEISEVIVAYSLKQIKGNYYFLNIDNYYKHLILFFDDMLEKGFITKKRRDMIRFIDSSEELISLLSS